MAQQSYNGDVVDLPPGWRIVTVNGDDYVVDDQGRARGAPNAFKVDASTLGTATERSYADIADQNKRNAKELGVQAGIEAAGALANLALTAAPTSADTRNSQKLAELTAAEKAGRLGLDAAERQDFENTMLNPARAQAEEARVRLGQRLAGAGGTSLATQVALQQANESAIQKTFAAAGAEENRANIAKRAQQERELEQRTQYEANRQSQNLENIGATLGELGKMGGRIAAAQVQKRGLKDDELVAKASEIDANGQPKNPGLYKYRGDPAALRRLDEEQKRLERARAKMPVDVPAAPYRQAPMSPDVDASTAGVMGTL